MFSTKSVLTDDNVKIIYDVYGSGDIAFIFAHCWCGNRTYWKNQVKYFCKKYKCINIDLPGSGESGKNRSEWKIKTLAKDINQVIKNENISKAILIGHSLGGIILLEAATDANYTLLGLVGVDTFANIEFELNEEEMEIFVNPYKNDFAETTKEYVSAQFPPNADPLLKKSISDDLASADPKIAIYQFEEYLRYKTPKAFEKIDVPVVCINADRRPTNEEGLRRHIKKLELKIVENSGHFMILEQAEKFNRILENSIDKILAGKN